MKKFFYTLFFNNKIITLIRFVFLIALAIGIYEQNWIAVFITLIALFLTYFYVLFEKYNIFLPKEFEIIIMIFIFIALFLWELHNYYAKIVWLDALLHAFAGLAFWFIWFLILYIFYKSGELKAPIWTIALFAFCFSLALGALWEIFEFLMDEFFGANMQKSRWLEEIAWYFETRLWVRDTMFDLILDTLGALVASISWYLYLKSWEKISFFGTLVKKFEEVNTNLFKK